MLSIEAINIFVKNLYGIQLQAYLMGEKVIAKAN